jgi:hypothetical protein
MAPTMVLSHQIASYYYTTRILYYPTSLQYLVPDQPAPRDYSSEAPTQVMWSVLHGIEQVQYRLVVDKLEIRDEIQHENVNNDFSGHIGRANITRVPHIQKKH